MTSSQSFHIFFFLLNQFHIKLTFSLSLPPLSKVIPKHQSVLFSSKNLPSSLSFLDVLILTPYICPPHLLPSLLHILPIQSLFDFYLLNPKFCKKKNKTYVLYSHCNVFRSSFVFLKSLMMTTSTHCCLGSCYKVHY